MVLIPDDYAQANFQFSGAALPTKAEFTMAFDISTYPDNPADLAALCIAAWHDNFQNYQATGVVFDGVLVKFGPTATGPSAFVAAGSTTGSAGTPLDPAVALLVQKVTPFGGRAGRGRFYIPGCKESATDTGGHIVTETRATMQSDLTAFLGDLNAEEPKAVVLHGADSPLVTPSVITSLQLEASVATQRRRQRR